MQPEGGKKRDKKKGGLDPVKKMKGLDALLPASFRQQKKGRE